MEKTDDIIIRTEFYTREDVALDHLNIYLFGENAERTSGTYVITECPNEDLAKLYIGKCHSRKTQALIRGLHNAYPITTKKSPRAGDHFGISTPIEDFKLFNRLISEDLDRIVATQKCVIVPAGGFATGSAALNKDYAELLQRLLKEKIGLQTEIVSHLFFVKMYGLLPVQDAHITI